MPWPPSSPPPQPRKPPQGALVEAAVNCDLIAVRRLLKDGADVNERDGLGNTPLSRAVIYGYSEIARVLLDNGADIDCRNAQGNTPLMIVISSYAPYREALARMLLDRGANMDIRNNDGETAMSIAVSRSRPQIVEMLKATAATRKRLAEEFTRAAAAKKRAETLERQKRLLDLAKNRPGPGPKPPEAA